MGEEQQQKKITVKTKHAELSLEQLAEVQPGMARFMIEVGERFHVLYYGAKDGNWPLAQHELNQVIALFRNAGILRPKFAVDLSNFSGEFFNPMSEALRARDWRKFEDAYNKAVEGSYKYHDKYGYGFIRYVTPKNPPGFYDTKPHEEQKQQSLQQKK